MNPNFESQYIPYQATRKFSKTVLDYIHKADELRAFYKFSPDKNGILEAIAEKKKAPVDRKLLVHQLRKQYASMDVTVPVQKNIDLLLNENTFTICTAHQPNIFTGHLYFIYKVMHAIKMADVLSKEMSGFQFVPVFFMGSEDADLEELNHIVIDGKKYTWDTNQKGAVGRMIIDKKFIDLINALEGRLLTEPFGIAITTLIKECYQTGKTIETATFQFVHELFKDYGLIILLPDNAAFKKKMIDVFKDDLLQHTPSEIVKNTSKKLSANYPAQAHARDINLFYMKDDVRNRIVEVQGRFVVHETDIHFTKEEIIEELNNHPDRFSPNVILRGLFQEMILPDVAFIGGGGELAYWLQLKDLFEHFRVPYPVIILRNSFLILELKWQTLMDNLQITIEDIFKEREAVLKALVRKGSTHSLQLDEEKSSMEILFEKLRSKVIPVDITLVDHVEALKTRSIKKLSELEKKMIRAEKKKFEATGRQLIKIFSAVNGNGLQERTDNFMLFYAMWGRDFLDAVYKASLVFDLKFCVLKEG